MGLRMTDAEKVRDGVVTGMAHDIEQLRTELAEAKEALKWERIAFEKAEERAEQAEENRDELARTLGRWQSLSIRHEARIQELQGELAKYEEVAAVVRRVEERAERLADHHLEHHDDETARVFAPAEARIQELEAALRDALDSEGFGDASKVLRRALAEDEA